MNSNIAIVVCFVVSFLWMALDKELKTLKTKAAGRAPRWPIGRRRAALRAILRCPQEALRGARLVRSAQGRRRGRMARIALIRSKYVGLCTYRETGVPESAHMSGDGACGDIASLWQTSVSNGAAECHPLHAQVDRSDGVACVDPRADWDSQVASLARFC